MNVLVIGGTQFVGRAFVKEAARRGEKVTIFHRGSSEPADLPDVDHVHGDRDGQLDRLRGGTWEVVLDTCAYFPRVVREVAALADSFDRYALVSTIAVNADDGQRGSNEESTTFQPSFPDTEEVTGDTYGPLKAACEREAVREFGDRCLIIRPGYPVGPHDPTDRFTFYVRRASGGGEMLAPGHPHAPFQVLDVRDLATFMLDRIRAGDAGVYGVIGPGEPITMRDVLETARDAAGANTTLTWVSEAFLHSLGDEVQSWFPMWEPDSGCSASRDLALFASNRFGVGEVARQGRHLAQRLVGPDSRDSGPTRRTAPPNVN